MRTYVTREGDTADSIAWKVYGTTAAKVVEQLLDANKGLADRGPILPSNITVSLPDIDTTAKVEGVRLWD